MNQARWLTLPQREWLRSEGLIQLLERAGQDYARVWNSCEDPRWMVEMAAASGAEVGAVMNAVGRVCVDAWNHWTAGATDQRPIQILNAVSRWLRADSDAGFEDIWSTWELAEQVAREAREWHGTQQGAVLATAILNAVEGVHAFTTTARNLAEPEPGHDQHDPDRYRRKNEAESSRGLLHDAAEAVHRAAKAGSWWHSHSEPGASDRDHDAYANQILGFVIRQHLPAEQVIQGLRDRKPPG